MSEQDKQEFKLAIASLILFVTALLILGALTACEVKMRVNCEMVKSKVVTIGACSEFCGNCRVLLDNGHDGMVHMPVVGQTITYRRCEGEE